MARTIYWPEPSPATRRAHRVRWFVWVADCNESGNTTWERVPHASSMKDKVFEAWDAVCACGFDTQTGGAVKSHVRDMVIRHRSDEEWKAMTEDGKAAGSDDIPVGEGILNWPAGERVSGRWGTVFLHQGDDHDSVIYPARVPEGHYGTLKAEVTEILRKRIPDDDLILIGPDAPPRDPCSPGDVVVLGKGWIFRSQHVGYPVIGIRPSTADIIEREEYGEDWMDCERLSLVQHQRVRLIFEPGREGA